MKPTPLKAERRILVVEDEPSVQLMTLKILTQYGYRVEIARNGYEALRRVMATKSKCAYDFILMDLDMPILDGFETSIELKRYGFENPIVSFSSKEHLKLRVRKSTMKYSIGKPIVHDEFLKMLQAMKARSLRPAL